MKIHPLRKQRPAGASVAEISATWQRFIRDTVAVAEDKLPGAVMHKLRGNPEASYVLVAPPSTADDYANQMPLVGEPGRMLHAELFTYQLNSEQDFLVVPSSIFGNKPNKAACAPCVRMVKYLSGLPHVKALFCAGLTAYKYIFNEGAAGSTMLPGLIIYPAQFHYRPLVVLPEPAHLVPIPKSQRIPYAIRRQNEAAGASARRLIQLALHSFRALPASK